MKKNLKVIICGWYGATNIGDELLLGLMFEWIHEIGGELTIISLNPEVTARKYGTHVVDFDNLGEIAQALSDSDLFVMGGGGIFQDHSPFNFDGLYDSIKVDVARYARPFYMARQFGVRTLILAHGVGPLNSTQSREIVRDVFSLVDAVSLRDEQSAVLLKNIGVERELQVAADPGWSAASQLLHSAKNLNVSIDNKEKKVLALIVREWWKDAGWEDKLIDAVNRQLPDDWTCQWFAFQHAVDENRASSDKPFLDRLTSSLDTRIQSEIVVCSDVEQTFADIGRCDAVVSMRLHGSILSLALNKPCAFLEYDDKMTQAHNMANIPPELRIKLTAPHGSYQELFAQLFSGKSNWRLSPMVLNSLQTSALEHRQLLVDSMAHAAGQIKDKWKSNDFDWLGAWLQNLIWQRQTLLRANGKANDLLLYRDFQINQRDIQYKERKIKYDGLLQDQISNGRNYEKIIENLRSQIDEKNSYIQDKEIYISQLIIKNNSQNLYIQNLRSQIDEKNSYIQDKEIYISQLIIKNSSQNLYILDKEVYIAKLNQEIERRNAELGEKMKRKILTFSQKVKRAIYLYQNGGLRALISTIRMRRRVRQAQLHNDRLSNNQTFAIGPGIAPLYVDRLEEAAQLRSEEIVIVASHPFSWMAEHHRAGQLARAAIGAGHRVVYVSAGVDAEMQIPAGMLFLHLEGLDLEALFNRISQNAVIINFVVDQTVLPIIEFARIKGLRVNLDVCGKGGNLQIMNTPLFDKLASFANKICFADDSDGQFLKGKGYDVMYLPTAVSHTFFDPYREYAQPAQFKNDSRDKAIVFAPDGEGLIDWKYLTRTAELNPGVAFYLLGLTNYSDPLPVNIVMLTNEYLNQVNAFIAFSEFVLAPVIPMSTAADAVLQGIIAGGFLGKPVISSQPLMLENLQNLIHLPVPEYLGSLANRFSEVSSNELFVAKNACLARLESLISFQKRKDVSVVILIHNNVRIIGRCLETLLHHCGAFIHEVIVVDNASVDGGAEFVEMHYPQVKLIRNPENGCSSGRNLGVKHSTGKYLAFFDSDQWFTGGSGFAEALAILENNDNVGVIGWNAGWFDSTRTDLGGMIADYCPNRAMNSQAIRIGFRSDIGFLGTSGFFMRSVTFDAIEGFDTYYDPTCFEDTDLCFQIRALKMDVSFRDLSGIRHQPHQTTGADSGSDKYRKLFLRNANYFKEKWKAYPDFYLDYKI
ncbi:hypothetical protein B9Z51_09510 [Limnohabitans sp. T6-5]|uniref:polysaccharide pyruvyl transferase family protein n=1 Tax=Limnohabitans sp. T6-5 TaxID=1100724 RepID=UPI000D39C8BF|nr:polysaccharide pyruvyl transferase family protein [Limnohabitans sp. T6-5]PUE09144.1 hypothetical protein B9Z51_09510 [Limnohabitans sp. T6-5]